MTFRHATLIHKHATQQQRRTIIPGISLAAAALVAVVLFLGSFETAQAEGKRSGPDCSGLGAISLTASSSSAVSGLSASTSQNCDVSLEVSQFPAASERPPDAEPCVINATPSPIGTTGTRVDFSSTGNCDGVRIRLTTNVGASLQSSGYAAAYAKLVGEDTFDLDMWHNKSAVTWGYTSTTVNSASHYPSTWLLWNGWEVTNPSSSLTRVGETYRGLYEVEFHAFQYTIAYTEATLIAKPSGAFSCDFDIEWDWKPIGFDHYTVCDSE